MELKEELDDPEIWADQARSKELLKEIKNLEEEIKPIDRLLDEVLALEDLAATEEEEENAAELEKNYETLLNYFEKIKNKSSLSGEYDERDAIVSIYAGAGGDDAEDWTGILLKMYHQWAKRHNFEAKILDQHKNEFGGYKNITFEIKGKFAYGWLKNEAGVHRLVRISPFSPKKLRHTSFALVEIVPRIILPKEVEINPADLEIRFTRSSGPGGQNVNKRETAVQIFHKPSKIQVKCDSERSQEMNRQKAMEILSSKLLKLKAEETEKEKKALKGEIPQKIEWGHQIRSYVFHPYRLVKDHRTNVETGNVEKVLAGEIDDFLKAE